MLLKSHKISVIIPVYGTEIYLQRCIDSVINQSYSELEIIIVNDCSPNNCKEIVETYQQIDNRIKYIEHDKNKGLFQARLTGASIATGEYIAFVDSDDYIAVDYYRQLLKASVTEQADMVCASHVMVYESDNSHKINTFNIPPFNVLENEQIIKEYFEQEGHAFHWHAVWNKIYSKKLWDKAVVHYDEIKSHLIMAEDFVYSTVLFYFAKKYVTIEYDGYYYFQNANASTSIDGNVNKFLKNLNDLKIAFDFVENFINKVKLGEFYQTKFSNWKLRYSRFWKDNIKHSSLSILNKEKATKQLIETFGKNVVDSLSSDHFFYLSSTKWDNRYELLLNEIKKDNIEYVSFDIFDTLIVRPFYDPHDLFVLLDPIFNTYNSNNSLLKFSLMRENAEKIARERINIEHPNFNEVTLDEIYSYINSIYSISEELINKMKQHEIELEIKYCSPRKSAKNVYEMAKQIGKKIILVSDMYLPVATIQNILTLNGYTDYSKLYLSSNIGATKDEGSLFKHIINELKIEPNSVIHIGDNWNSDIISAQKYNLKTYYYPKAISRLLNHIPDVNTGNSTLLYFQPRGHWINYEYGKNYFLIRSMLGLIANKYFDNPYRSFSEYSDYNADPKFFGYYGLGMHIITLTKWLAESASKYDTLHFVARDGYLPKKVYDVISSLFENSPKSNYLYLSRKALIPTLLLTNEGRLSLPNFINVKSLTPKELLVKYLKVEITDSLKDSLLLNKISLDTNFGDNLSTYYNFTNVLNTLDVSFHNLEQYNDMVVKYLNQHINSNDAIFDIGYSATSQMVMAHLNNKVDAFYIHTNKEIANEFGRQHDFKFDTFYSFSPAMSGTLREYIYSDLNSSCVGYKKEGSRVLPVFDESQATYIEKYIINSMQTAAEQFAIDFVTIFSNELKTLAIRKEEGSLPYEMFLHAAKLEDRNMFAECYFEDDAYYGLSKINLKKQWEDTLNYFNILHPIEMRVGSGTVTESSITTIINGKNKYIKGILYFLLDRDTFKSKVSDKFKNRPFIYKPLKFTYKSLRKVKRLCVGPR